MTPTHSGEVSILEASTSGVRGMADGTLRISIDFEPRNAKAAYALFGMPGTSIAVTGLKDGHAAVSNPLESEGIKTEEKPKGGALAKLAGQWCADPVFWEWLVFTGQIICDRIDSVDREDAISCVRMRCDVASRAELDHNPAAADKFHRLIREPYMQYLKERS